MSVSDRSSSLEDLEPLDLTELDLFNLRREHVSLLLEGASHDDAYRYLRMCGLLPHGTPGEILFAGLRNECGAFARAVQDAARGAPFETRSFDLDLNPFRITGTLKTCGPDRLVLQRPGVLKGSNLFTAWIGHLVLCALSPGLPVKTCFIARDRTVELDATDNAREILSMLMEHYWKGLTCPLPFFPETSWKYASPGGRPGPAREERMKNARKAWESDRFGNRAESLDPAVRICFRGRAPLDEEFEKISLNLFNPLLLSWRAG